MLTDSGSLVFLWVGGPWRSSACVCLVGREKKWGVRTSGGMFYRSLLMYFGGSSLYIYIYIYKNFFFFFFIFFVQFNVPFKIISLISRRANQKVGRKREYPGKNHLTHAQVELDLSHLWPVWGRTHTSHSGEMIEWSRAIMKSATLTTRPRGPPIRILNFQ